MAVYQISPSGKALTPKRTCEKLDRKKSWLWDRVKNDPNFPKPIYYGPKAPMFLEVEIDGWLVDKADKSRQAA